MRGVFCGLIMLMVTSSKKMRVYSFLVVKKPWIFFGLAAVLALLAFFLWLPHFQKPNPPVLGIILFEGNGCAHCAKVETFIKNNNVEQKIAFTRLEVFDNSANASILADRAQACGLPPARLGVPFLWDGKKCVIGDVDIIQFFQQRLAKKS